MSCETGITFACITQTVSDLGVIGVLLLILWGLKQRWWVPGWYYTELAEREAKYRELAWSGNQIARQAAEIAKTAVEKS